MNLFSATRTRLRQAELLSGVSLSKEMRKRIHVVTSQLTRAPCLAVVLVGDRTDSQRYVNHKMRAAAECGIELRIVHLPSTIRQLELHRALASVNGDVSVDGVILQLPLPPHLHARPALFHIHPGKDVDGLHPLNAGNLFLQDQSPLLHVLTQKTATPAASAAATTASFTPSDRMAQGLVGELMLLPSHGGGYNALHRRTHESKFFVPCTALAIRSILFSYLSRTEAFAHLLPSMNEGDETQNTATTAASSAAASSPTSSSASSSSPSSSAGDAASATAAKQLKKRKGSAHRDLHAVIVNKSMVVGVPTAALLQRAGGFVVTTCSRSNSIDAIRCLARQADVLISAYGEANVFDATCVKPGAVVIDAAINELPRPSNSGTAESSRVSSGQTNSEAPTHKVSMCGDVDIHSVSPIVAAVTKTPGGVGPLTVSHLMMNVLKAYRLRHANHLYYNNIYTEFLKMYGTYDKVRDYAPSAALTLRSPSATMPGVSTTTAAAGVAGLGTAHRSDEEQQKNAVREEWEAEGDGDDESLDDEDADNESYEV